MPDGVFMDCVAKAFGITSRVSFDDRLADIGCDSLRFVQLVVLVEAALHVRFADEMLNHRRFERVGDVSTYADELYRARQGASEHVGP